MGMSPKTKKAKSLLEEVFREFKEEEILEIETEDEFEDIHGTIEEVQFAQVLLKKRNDIP